MICPLCSGPTRTLSAIARNRSHERTRSCIDCGHEFTTVEIISSNDPAAVELLDWVGENTAGLEGYEG